MSEQVEGPTGEGWKGEDFDIYAPDRPIDAKVRVRAVRSTRPPFRIVKDVILVSSGEPGVEGYLDAIGNPGLLPKLRRRSLLGMLTCDPLLNIEATAVLETVPIPE